MTVYTLQEAEAMIGETVCEHCGALHSVRRRSLNSTMAKQLIALYQLHQNPEFFSNLQVCRIDGNKVWVHASRYLTAQRMDRDFAKLRFWGLIEEHPATSNDGNPHCGYFRMTEDGAAFCENRTRVYKYILTRNQGTGFVGFIDDGTINIIEAGRNTFDYTREINGAV